jgi:hypothetical protein
MAFPKSSLALAALLLAAGPARASWLQCVAMGNTQHGQVGYYTTLVDVGAVPEARMAILKQRLVAYAKKFEPTLTTASPTCVTYDDMATAASHYSQGLNGLSRRMGWDHVVVVQPSDWLPASDIVSDPVNP